MRIELESLRISERLLQVLSTKEGASKNHAHMMEFTCFEDGSFIYEVSFKYLGRQYTIKGSKECSLSAIGKEFEVPKIISKNIF